MKKGLKIGLMVAFMLYIFIFVYSNSIAGQPVNTDTIFLNGEIHPKKINYDQQKITAESDKTDNMNVNPKSGRWNVNDANTTSDIDTGNLHLINTANSSDLNEYSATRPLADFDTAVSSRFKSNSHGNISEYFRDVKGDPIDFVEDSEGSTSAGATCTKTRLDGIYKISSCSATTYVQINFPVTINSVDLYDSVEVNIQGTSGLRTNIRNQGIVSLAGYQNILTTFSTLSFSLSYAGATNRYPILYLGIFLSRQDAGNFDGTEIFYINTLKLFGSFDYAMNEENAIGDAWDFKDSWEYFYNAKGNISDFEDGTVEGWVKHDSEALSVVSYLNENWLEVSEVSSLMQIDYTGLNIVSSTYKYFAIEIWSSAAVASFAIKDSGGNTIGSATTLSAGVTTLKTFDGSADADWTGTETAVQLYIGYGGSGAHSVRINMVYIYDTDVYGDLESFNEGTNCYFYVDPLGYSSIRVQSSISTDYRTPAGTNIDTSIYQYAKISIKADSSSARYFALAIDSNLITPITSVSSSFQTFTFDLSTDSDWTGISDRIRFYFFSTSGGAVPSGNEKYQIDYLKIFTPDSIEQDFVIGLKDDQGNNFFNLSQHWFNSTIYQFRFELYDPAEQISSYYYSSNLTTTLYDGYFDIKLQFNTFQSEFSIQLSFDNGTDFIGETSWGLFTSLNYRPAIFANDRSLVLFFSSYTIFQGCQEIYIDYIDAQYKERGWEKQDSSDESSYWQIAQPLSVKILQGASADETLTNQMYLPYFDAVSGTFWTNCSNAAAATAGSDFDLDVYFRIYGIDRLSGTSTEILSIYVNWLSAAVFVAFVMNIQTGGTVVYQESSTNALGGLAASGNFIPGYAFSASLTEDRSILTGNVLWYINQNNMTLGYNSTSFNLTLSEVMSNPSQEFIIETTYNLGLGISDAYQLEAQFDDFKFVQRYFGLDFLGGVGSYIPTGLLPIGSTGRPNTFFGSNPLDPISYLQPLVAVIMVPIEAIKRLLDATLASIYGVALLTKIVLDDINGYAANIDSTLTGMSTDLFNMYTVINNNLPNIATDINTIKGYLLTIKNDISSISTDVGLMKTALDTINANIGTITTAIGTIDTNVATIATAIGTINTNLGLMKTALDTVNANIGFMKTALDTVNANIALMKTALDTINTNVITMVSSLSTIVTSLGTLVTDVGSLVTLVTNLPGAFWTAFETWFSGFLSDFIDQILDLLPFGLGTWIRGFNNLNIATIVQQVLDLIDWVLTFSVYLLMIYLGLYMFAFPIMKNLNDFQTGAMITDGFHNAFALHGFDFNTAIGTIPIRVNAFFVWLLLTIALGYFNYIWPTAII